MSDDSLLTISSSIAERLGPYLPPPATTAIPIPPKPFTTLTFATSLDSALSLGPGLRTALSGPKSKAMTHYLRACHDAIVIGVGTAIADDPGLNCRIAPLPISKLEDQEDEQEIEHLNNHPRPIIIDPTLRWSFTSESKVLRLAREGKGLAPWVITTKKNIESASPSKRQLLESLGGKFIPLKPIEVETRSRTGVRVGEDIVLSKIMDYESTTSSTSTIPWTTILSTLATEGIRSVMIEGGGGVINTLLSPEPLSSSGKPSSVECNQALIDSLILTISPLWLGRGGVVVSPERRKPDVSATQRLKEVKWLPMGEDVVMCGRLR